jgi:hypothetical protein
MNDAGSPQIDRKMAWVSLVLISLVSAGLWRLEMNFIGWEGLQWVERFHWAVPAGVSMFILWAVLASGLPSVRRRAVAAVLAVPVAGILFALTQGALFLIFMSGPTAMPFATALGGNEKFAILRELALVWFPSIPVVVSVFGRLLGVPISRRRIIVSTSAFVASLPLALLFMEFVDSSFPSDPIHTIKTGFIIPPLIVALGIPFLPSE